MPTRLIVKRKDEKATQKAHRLHSLLRSEILNAMLMVMRPGKILTRVTEIIRHVCDPPRRRKSQSAAARSAVLV
ncbi:MULTISPECIES: hypothetical protein [unclassified Mesorhizobium]|uniref:hypothetical protein n=1 Tax=unclassified Mesorhizobium TaxID=325217 RepID=UPI0003CEB169|nr:MULTISPECIES: hypothetical protein [unclassified Mesorhizobium]ESX27593.1 hypothetical protein X765_19620 [Mesorhizobium sp. LSHC440B00]ESX36476.1 hypothetical protein X763_13930 [Mesorhizobium sp. LSHC432A00]ESX41901.1 hypothetical protein X764_13445 [Mesorhizobium sp. LSHC440A00]ESX78367.1 hypothetical protein X757_06795 [Mesorhizobium sp. LSHC414A00]ESZ35809.1 hypothetical protein X731_30750 [Mesorhizobium sp. L2C054A000]